MSDFLSNLAARSLDPLPVIQPRLPSLFEPLPPDNRSWSTPVAVWHEDQELPPEEAAFANTERRAADVGRDSFQQPAFSRPKETRTAEHSRIERTRRGTEQPPDFQPLPEPVEPENNIEPATPAREDKAEVPAAISPRVVRPLKPEIPAEPPATAVTSAIQPPAAVRRPPSPPPVVDQPSVQREKSAMMPAAEPRIVREGVARCGARRLR